MPFAQTALIHDGDENILHIGACRFRIVGNGVLRNTLYSMDSGSNQEIATITMSGTMEKEPTILANFKSQRVMLRVYTIDINETFNVNRIIFYVKPIWSEFPR